MNQKIIAISGYSGSGKTTLLKQVIARLRDQHFRVGVIKHAHHDMDIDLPGKDSYELRKSGAIQTVVACDNRYALIRETPDKPVDLEMLRKQFVEVDLILVEGFKDEKIPKIICHRMATQTPLFMDEFTVAVACDYPLDTTLPQLDINNAAQIVDFIKTQLCLANPAIHP
ncbi:molybdopterin-guanine dinucleotide biosynthesis protein B [Orbaceae bacterium ESL0727]|nr:molybdopterin-guanine dinucleotide biosynthesis protein B [Orbaceae bacterium ESL0727]